jgi:hypothetical protein
MGKLYNPHVYWNRYMSNLSGWMPEDCVGRPCTGFVGAVTNLFDGIGSGLLYYFDRFGRGWDTGHGGRNFDFGHPDKGFGTRSNFQPKSSPKYTIPTNFLRKKWIFHWDSVQILAIVVGTRDK